MRILWVVTKSPWPERDGGRVLMTHTLRALAADGHELVLVSPFDPAREDPARIAVHLGEMCEPHLVAASPGSRVRSLVRARWRRLPLSIGRHAIAAVKGETERLLASRPFDVVHAEQLQALAQCDGARLHGLPVVLRAQNVESDLWAALRTRRPLLWPLARREAARLARYEGQAVGRAAATVALTARDAERLRALAGQRGAIRHVPAPFPATLPAGPPLDGHPAVVVLGGGWLPNRDGTAWFVNAVWRHVRDRCPDAVLHVFGAETASRAAPSLVSHPAPADSRVAFAAGAILAVPVRIASGVRMKILESWARGVPVVATPEAAEGLDARDGEELSIGGDARELAAAIGRVHEDASFARASIEAGRARLGAHHDPRRIARRLADVYAEVAGGARR